MTDAIYLDLVRDVLENGVKREDRTGNGTLSLFGQQMRFNLEGDSFPLLTTKRIFFRGVAEELLWFVSGDTDSKTLVSKGVRIWDEWGSREFLDRRGLTENKEGDLGPIYGYQWRHFGASYPDRSSGVDQLSNVIELIKNDPTSRRILMSAWNPKDNDSMALPPCHVLCQFYVCDGRLSCSLYQRSGDLGLGVPFNIASYALLTKMIAHVCDLETGELVHTIGDAHVYLDHVDDLRKQLSREPRSPPSLVIRENTPKDIDLITMDDIVLTDYYPHPRIKMKVAV